jgi:hypothetical protein
MNAFSAADVVAFTPTPERVAEPKKNEGLERAYHTFRQLYLSLKET